LFLFIFESIGTSELFLIGIIALMFLGPRKLPELARKAGKIMSEFRGTANEFKETWQREVNFDEEEKLLDIKNLDAVEPSGYGPRIVKEEEPDPSSYGPRIVKEDSDEMPAAPEIKELDPARLEELKASAASDNNSNSERQTTPSENDKQNWL
jgi:Tat protein translocase TatB subunit